MKIGIKNEGKKERREEIKKVRIADTKISRIYRNFQIVSVLSGV